MANNASSSTPGMEERRQRPLPHSQTRWNGGGGGGIQIACHMMHRWVGQYTIIGCGLFIYMYVLLGKLSFLSVHVYQPLISTLSLWMIRNERYQTDKAIVPLFMIVIPMLLAGMIASLCHIKIHGHPVSRIPPAYGTSFPQRMKTCCNRGANDRNVILFVVIYLPLLVYTSMSMAQKHPFSSMSWQSSHRNSTISEIGNTFGIAALFGMSFLLIPVTKYSYLLQYFTFTQNLGIQQRIHQSLGTFVMISVLFHVVLHLYRWYIVQKYNNVLSMLFIIPSTCWNPSSWTEDDQMLLCPQQDTATTTTTAAINNDCTCYGRVRNVMGGVAAIALLIISLTTIIVPTFRRYYYKTFYLLHRVLGPIVFLFVILHWNRSIIYLSANILYYLAGTVPIWMIQSNMKARQQLSQLSHSNKVNNDIDGGHVRITSIERIASCHGNDDSPLMVLTFETTKEVLDEQYYHPGQYIKLHVPSISCESHPFTINQVLTDTDTANYNSNSTCSPHMYQLRVLFRCVGPFTKQLAYALWRDPSSTTAISSGWPNIYLDGFYGPTNRLTNILHDHDHIVFVAGGIGITPYLSLLNNIVQEAFHHEPSNHDECALKRVTFYWTCRDAKLIEYVQREYFEPIVQLLHHNRNVDCSRHLKKLDLHIHIHQTHPQEGNVDCSNHRENLMTRLPKNVSYTNLEQEQTDEDDVVPSNDFAGSTNMLPLSGDGSGIPFAPSHFFPGPRTTIRSNLVSCTIYSCIVWIGLLIIWYMYTRHQSSDTMLPRILAPLAIVVHTYVVSRGMYWLLAQSPMLRHRQWLRGGYNYYRKESNDEFVDIVTEENNRTAVKSSDWMPIPTSDDNAGTLTKSSSVEMGLVHDIRVESPLWNGPDDRSLESNGRGVEVDTSSDVIEMSIGRPTVHQILRQFDKNCHRPGLYVCGTSTLMQDIRNAVNERSSRHCRRNRPSYIALYEETFEI